MYYGLSKLYVGKVLGGNDHYTKAGTGRTMRGIKIKFEYGSEEWKDPDAILNEDWYVKENDPAIPIQVWHELNF